MIKRIKFTTLFILSLLNYSVNANDAVKDSRFALTEDEYEASTKELTRLLSDAKSAVTTLEPALIDDLTKQFVNEKFRVLTLKDKQVGVVIFNAEVFANREENFAINILHVPHQYHDKYTLEIAAEMFNSDLFDMLIVNQVHRYTTEDSDMSNQSMSLFNVSADALIASNRTGKIFQMHGFAKNKRKTDSAQQADLILSNGSAIPSITLYKMQSCLSSNFELLGRLYGREVFELGGTKNSVAKQIRKNQKNIEFIHIELPLETRQLILNNHTSTGIGKCLVD